MSSGEAISSSRAKAASLAIWAKRRGRIAVAAGSILGQLLGVERRRRDAELGVGLALGSRRRRRSSPGRSCGRACLRRPAVPGSGWGASAPVRRPGRRRSGRWSRLTSRPIRSISSNGPIRKPPPRRTTRSIVAASATPSPSIRSDSREKGRASAVGDEAGACPWRGSGSGPSPARPRSSSPALASEDALGGDHLDQLHQRRRVEEVHADHALGVGHAGGDVGDPQRGGVGGEDRLRAADRGQPPRTASASAPGPRALASISSSQPASSPIAGAGPTRSARRVGLGLAPAPARGALGQGLAELARGACRPPPGTAS